MRLITNRRAIATEQMTNMDNNSDDSLALLKQGVEVLKTQRHAVILSWLLLSIAGIVTVSLMPNIYRATITILVEPQKIPERYVASTATSDLNAHLGTLTQQVLSASRLQEIADKDNLYPIEDQDRSKTRVGARGEQLQYLLRRHGPVACGASCQPTSCIFHRLEREIQPAGGTCHYGVSIY
jgi:hypothetical protein